MSDRHLLMLLYVFLDPAARGLWRELARRLVTRKPAPLVIDGKAT